MMRKTIIILVITVVYSYVQCDSNRDSKILSLTNELKEDGYDFEFETSNGIQRKETGVLKTSDQNEPTLAVNGQFSFKFPDGTPFRVTFTADEKGYRPKIYIGSSVVKEGTQEQPKIMLVNRVNFEPKSISSAAIASITGGGIGK